MINQQQIIKNPSNILSIILFFSLLMNSLFDFSVKSNVINFICLILVSTIGIYHGAFDIKKIIKISRYFNIGISKLNTIYVFISLLTISLWLSFPPLLIIIFLILSAHHFGSEEYLYYNSNPNFLVSFLRGLMIIILPFVFQFDKTTEIFHILNLIEEKNTLSIFNSNYLLITFIGFANLFSSFIYVKSKNGRILMSYDMLLIVISNYFFEPIFAFSLYFCFLHSTRNIIKINKIDCNPNFLQDRHLFLTLLSTFLLLMTVFIFLYNFIDISSTIIYIIFIGLAALTIPHIAIDIIFNKLIIGKDSL
tara:strand:- start:1330 stop:2250 length:921 start_codon:yes stop_codon:yes gene_type:complete